MVIIEQGYQAVVKSIRRSRSGGFLMVGGRFCESRELRKYLLVCFCLKSFSYGSILGALVDIVRETELSKVAQSEKARRAGAPACTAVGDVSRDCGSIIQANEMIRKFEDVRAVDLEVLCNFSPEIGVLGEADTVVGPEDTKAE